MTIKFEIPFPVNLTDEQITDMEEDINKRIQIFNRERRQSFELDNYLITLLVELREVGKRNPTKGKVQEKPQSGDGSFERLAGFIMGEKK